MDNYKAVLDFFAKVGKAVRAGDVVEGTGVDKKEVEKAMNKLKKEGKIVSPKRCYWEIKQD
ncbi:MAG: MarR family transcriptional regulator [Firmicutes bacterium]|nr:MarR family transcriptional regulator [Bacillota bacterium]